MTDLSIPHLECPICGKNYHQEFECEHDEYDLVRRIAKLEAEVNRQVRHGWDLTERIAELEADKKSLKEKLTLYLGGWPSLEERIEELEEALVTWHNPNTGNECDCEICNRWREEKQE